MILVQSHGKGRVGGQDELGISFTPIPTDRRNQRKTKEKMGLYLLDACDIDWCAGSGLVDHDERKEGTATTRPQGASR